MHHCQASINCSYFINREIEEESKLHLAIERVSFTFIMEDHTYLVTLNPLIIAGNN